MSILLPLTDKEHNALCLCAKLYTLFSTELCEIVHPVLGLKQQKPSSIQHPAGHTTKKLQQRPPTPPPAPPSPHPPPVAA